MEEMRHKSKTAIEVSGELPRGVCRQARSCDLPNSASSCLVGRIAQQTALSADSELVVGRLLLGEDRLTHARAALHCSLSMLGPPV